MSFRLLLIATTISLSCAAFAQPPQTVQVTKPSRRDVDRRTTYPAVLAAWQEVALVPRVSGEVVELHVDIGDRVKKGQVLLRLDNPQLEAEVLAAQADVTESSATLRQQRAEESAARTDLEAGRHALRLGAEQTQRLQALQRAQSATVKEAEEAQKYQIAAQANIEQATAKVEVARAKVQVAEARLQSSQAKLHSIEAQQGYLSIRAPFDGVITGRTVDVGSIVAPGATTAHGLLNLQDDSRIRVLVDVPEVEAASARKDTSADVTVDALRTRIPGKISRSASALNAEVKTLRAQIDMENQQQKLMAGMFAHVCLLLDVHKDVMAVPSKAVVTKGGNSNVLMVADGKVKQLPITIGFNNGSFTEVKSGLTGNEDVIVSSRENLGNGMAVQVETSQGAAK